MDESAKQKEALRIQAAAVAAQQAALDEQEAQLNQRRAALEQQEEQLAAHLEDKRRHLVQLGDRIESEKESLAAEREVLQTERTAFAKQVEKLTSEQSRIQKDLLEKQEKLQAERNRLGGLHRRLRKRWQDQWTGERQRVKRREEELANEACNLEHEAQWLGKVEQTLERKQLEFNGQFELGRRQLRDAWSKVKLAQQQWRQRRGKERATLKLRARELEQTELKLAEGQDLLRRETATWQARRQTLEAEVAGLESRVQNQREKIRQQDQEILRREVVPPQSADQPARSPEGAVGNQETRPPAAGATNAVEHRPGGLSVAGAAEAKDSLQRRVRALEKLAAELADQRRQLVEQWHRLATRQRQWESDREQAASALEAIVARVLRQEQTLANRERTADALEVGLRQKQDELVKLRQSLVGWRARLEAREAAWQGERSHLLLELRQREEVAGNHLNALVETRQTWAKRRRTELERLRREREVCEHQRQQLSVLRQEFVRRTGALEEHKRILAEKALALEQVRRDCLTKAEDAPAAERKIERLRRRWLTQNTLAIRAIANERKGLQEELTRLEARHVELERRAEEVAGAGAAVAEKLTAWEHKQALAAARQARLQQELQTAHAQRACTEEVLARMREEIEEVARNLLEDAEPTILPLAA
jgi:chromosome segregation ATPase